MCICVGVYVCYLEMEERVEVGDDDVPVLHLAAHVLDSMDGGLVVGLRAASLWETLQPHAACLAQLIKDQASQFHCLYLCTGTHTSHTHITHNCMQKPQTCKDKLQR